jgi:hypothetical protein
MEATDEGKAKVTQLRPGMCAAVSPRHCAKLVSLSGDERMHMTGRQTMLSVRIEQTMINARSIVRNSIWNAWESGSGYRVITPRHHTASPLLSSPLFSTSSFICHCTPKHRSFFHGRRRRAVSTLDISPFVPRVRHSRLSPTSKGEATPEAQAS